MTNFDYVQETVDLFEESLEGGEPYTTAAGLASRIGYSPHHLGRLFQTICGQSLGRYILKRRLSEAATAIRSRSLNAGDAARRFGWEDYSAFARAVRKEFGVSPGNLGGLDTREIRLTIRARPRIPEPRDREPLEPHLLTTRPFHATGLVFFMGMNHKGFHKPWRIFTANRALIRGVIGEESWQISSWDNNASSEDDGLWIHCAVETDRREIQDMRFFSREMPAMKALSFAHTGPIETIFETYHRIFREYLPTSPYRLAGNTEFQCYSPDGRVQICLPLA